MAGFAVLAVLAVVLAFEADLLVVVSGSTIGCGAGSDWALGWADGWLVCFGAALGLDVAVTSGCFLAERCVVFAESVRFCVVVLEDLLFAFEVLDRLLFAFEVLDRLLDDGIWGSDT